MYPQNNTTNTNTTNTNTTNNAAAPLPNHHVCGPSCTVESLFGNAYRCVTSGAVHVCDRNCDQRVPYDRYSTICVVSKRLGPPLGGQLGAPTPTAMMMGDAAAAAAAAAAARKRSCGGDDGHDNEAALVHAQVMLQRQDSSKRGRVSGGHENDAAFVAAP